MYCLTIKQYAIICSVTGEQEHPDYGQLLYVVGQRDFCAWQGNDRYHLATDQ
ncbi:hypothetical protein [Anabaena catenula]|uniref:Uncharacterized protein n=1 Tax=Anabaena catenula FACHB-362 TaxID=2692877 RepID=A0ABR8J4M7_9NOST|nr:hypothetical protein [Anabaena catenula]MBD2692086.1 hypothetical protein [Anabaena catenula FACHB-362]